MYRSDDRRRGDRRAGQGIEFATATVGFPALGRRIVEAAAVELLDPVGAIAIDPVAQPRRFAMRDHAHRNQLSIRPQTDDHPDRATVAVWRGDVGQQGYRFAIVSGAVDGHGRCQAGDRCVEAILDQFVVVTVFRHDLVQDLQRAALLLQHDPLARDHVDAGQRGSGDQANQSENQKLSQHGSILVGTSVHRFAAGSGGRSMARPCSSAARRRRRRQDSRQSAGSPASGSPRRCRTAAGPSWSSSPRPGR